MADEKKIKEKVFEKMTSKELRVIALEIPGISGVHGMNKPELISEIKKARGIKEKVNQKKDSSVREVKAKINALRNKQKELIETNDVKRVKQLRRRINKLKKKTRRAA
jgi:hypothetical protein